MPQIAGLQGHLLLRNITVQYEVTCPRFVGLSGPGDQRGRAGLPCRRRSASSGQNVIKAFTEKNVSRDQVGASWGGVLCVVADANGFRSSGCIRGTAMVGWQGTGGH